MSKFIKTFVLTFTICGAILYLIPIGVSMFDYNDIMNGSYQTPWFDNRWWVDPYTNWKLSHYPSILKPATNGVGDIWLVKEVRVADKTWWTRKAILSKALKND
jgi:hypothetical protein